MVAKKVVKLVSAISVMGSSPKRLRSCQQLSSEAANTLA
jgi:hypothetical protein